MTFLALQQRVLKYITDRYAAWRPVDLVELMHEVAELPLYRNHFSRSGRPTAPQLRAVVLAALKVAEQNAIVKVELRHEISTYVRTGKESTNMPNVIDQPSNTAKQKLKSDVELRRQKFETFLAKLSPDDRERVVNLHAAVNDPSNFVLSKNDYEKMIKRNARRGGVEASDLDMDE